MSARHPRAGVTQLKSGSVGFGGAVVQAAANAAPALGLTAGLVFLAPLAAVASPFAMLVGALIALCLALVIAEFARKLPTAGAFYTYIVTAIGGRAGFVAGVLLFAAYLAVLPFQAAFFANFSSSYFATLGIHTGWVVWVVAMFVLSTGLAVAGISRSLKVGLIALAFEILVFSVLSIAILVQSGRHGLSPTPFDPSRAPGGVHGSILAIVYGIFAFAGFESATTLGEEASKPKKTIPRAVIGTVVVLGIYYVVATYAGVVGFGTSAAGVKALTGSATPYNDLARQYVGSAMSTLVTLAVVSSLVGVNIVSVNAGARMFFAMGRDRLLPSFFGRASGRQTPGIAALCIGVGALVMTLISSAIWGTSHTAAWAGFLLTLYFIGAYAVLTVGLPLLYRRVYRDEWSYLKHAVIPLITLAGLGLVTYGNVYPLPPPPLRYFIWATLATAVIATVIANILHSRKPEVLEEAGKIFGGLAEEEITSAGPTIRPG
jgi:amino acid transporter